VSTLFGGAGPNSGVQGAAGLVKGFLLSSSLLHFTFNVVAVELSTEAFRTKTEINRAPGDTSEQKT
jgi:hypothetical protein